MTALKVVKKAPENDDKTTGIMERHLIELNNHTEDAQFVIPQICQVRMKILKVRMLFIKNTL